MSEAMNDPSIIYLEPYPGSPDGRMWCEDPVWDEWRESEGDSVQYVRVMPGEPHWWVIRDEDGEIVVGGGREEMEAWWRDQVEDWEAGRRDPANAMISADEEHGYTLHGVYVGPAVEVGDHA